MAWIESHQELGRHPKAKKLARKLGVNLPYAIGTLHFLWWWALDYAPEGDISNYDPDDIADAVLWEKDSNELMNALIEARFVDRIDDQLHLHDWHDYAGRLIEYRQFQNERSKRKRELYGDYNLTAAVKKRDGDKCRYCGKEVNWKDRKSADGGTYDHVDPEGPNTLENLVVACRGCNSKKGRRTPEEAKMKPLQISGRLSTGNLPEIKSSSAYTVPYRTEPNQTENNVPVQVDSNLGEAIKLFQNEGFGQLGPIAYEEATALYDEFGGEWLKQAIGEAVFQNQRKLSFVRGVLTNWRSEGGMRISKGRGQRDGPNRKASGDDYRTAEDFAATGGYYSKRGVLVSGPRMSKVQG